MPPSIAGAKPAVCGQSVRPAACDAAVRPLAFVKTHKTGTSTFVNILQRMADWRRLRMMLPADGQTLGWPCPFEVVADGCTHQYDLLEHHAMLDAELMRRCLRTEPPPLLASIVREPISQARSVFGPAPAI